LSRGGYLRIGTIAFFFIGRLREARALARGGVVVVLCQDFVASEVADSPAAPWFEQRTPRKPKQVVCW